MYHIKNVLKPEKKTKYISKALMQKITEDKQSTVSRPTMMKKKTTKNIVLA